MSKAYVYNPPKYCEFEIKNKVDGSIEHRIQVDVPKEQIIIDGDLVVNAAQVDELLTVLGDALNLINLQIKKWEEENSDEG